MDSSAFPDESDQRRLNCAMYLQYLAKCMQKKKDLPLPVKGSDEPALRPVQPNDLAHLSALQPRMYPPEFSTKEAARKSFKRYGHWKKVDYRWVHLSDVKVPSGYHWTQNEGEENAGDGPSEVQEFWFRYLKEGVPVPAIRVYSEERLTLISDGVQRYNALKQAGHKFALVYYRYETCEEPPE